MVQNKTKILLISCSIHKKGNSQIALEYAEKGVKARGVKTDWLILNEFFFENGTKKECSHMIEKVKNADGIIMSTPVYFGTWTSLAQEFYEMLRKKNISLFPKVVGLCAVGAKRNGGQETTITIGGWDLMGLGACMVNDGFPTSQFGGAAVAGLIGDIRHDKEGKEACFNLGKRVAETAMILKSGKIDNTPVKIIDWPLAGKFSRCRGCVECPNNIAVKKGNDYKCRYFDDDLHKIHNQIIEADGIFPIEWDLKFHERTRYLRRDNYRLTYHVVHIPEIRWIPLFIKQNAILCRDSVANALIRYAKLIKTGKSKLSLEKQIYEPIGYKTKRVY